MSVKAKKVSMLWAECAEMRREREKGGWGGEIRGLLHTTKMIKSQCSVT